MFRIARNRFLDAFLKFLLLSSIIHTILMFIYSIAYNDIEHLNYFRILDISAFIPGLKGGIIPDIAGTVIMILLYLIIYFFFSGVRDKGTR